MAGRRVVQVLVLASAMALVSCQSDSDDRRADGGDVQSDDAGAAVDGEDAQSDGIDIQSVGLWFSDEVAAWQTDLEIVDGPATFTAGEGITVEVLDARITDLQLAPRDVRAAMVLGDDADPPVVFTVLLEATNATDHDIEWFRWPDLVIAGVGRLDADAWNSLALPRDGLPAGTTSRSVPVYHLPADVTAEELTGGEGHIGSGGVPFDVESGDRLGDGLDLTFTWEAA